MTDSVSEFNFEKAHVIDIYDSIAKDFDTTRNHIWPKNKAFFDMLCGDRKDLKTIDVGCGNGRNMKYLIDGGCSDVVGCDVSSEFVKICRKKDLVVQEENILNLSYDSNTFDNVICVAVIHHLSTDERRLQAIRELIRITKSGGNILIQVWAKEQQFSKKVYSENDVMIPWHLNHRNFEKKSFLIDIIICLKVMNLKKYACHYMMS